MFHTRPNQSYAPAPGSKGADPMGGGPGGKGVDGGGPPPPGAGPGVAYEPDYSIKEGVTDFELENDYIQFFKNIQGHHSCTHSSMIGPSDHRIPRSGKFDVTKKEALEKL